MVGRLCWERGAGNSETPSEGLGTFASILGTRLAKTWGGGVRNKSSKMSKTTE